MAALPESFDFSNLSIPERLALVERHWESIAAEEIPLTEAQRIELERRADDDDENPDDMVPWEQVKAEALARWKR